MLHNVTNVGFMFAGAKVATLVCAHNSKILVFWQMGIPPQAHTCKYATKRRAMPRRFPRVRHAATPNGRFGRPNGTFGNALKARRLVKAASAAAVNIKMLTAAWPAGCAGGAHRALAGIHSCLAMASAASALHGIAAIAISWYFRAAAGPLRAIN